MHNIIKFQEKEIYLTHLSNELEISEIKVWIMKIDAQE